MSFILDALKKSEIERQRQATPGLVDVSPVAPRPRFPLWAIGIAVLLGVNLIVLVVVLTRNDRVASAHPNDARVARIPDSAIDGSASPPASASIPPRISSAGAAPSAFASPGAAPAAPSASAATPRSAAKSPANFSPLDAPVFAPEIPVAQDASSSAPASPASATPNSSAPARDNPPRTAPAASMPAEPRLAATSESRENDEVLPTLDEINLTAQRAMPELHLDIHVYDPKPAARFVFINMRKYREGDALQEGPSIERITRDGVILSYQGLRFNLPRQ